MASSHQNSASSLNGIDEQLTEEKNEKIKSLQVRPTLTHTQRETEKKMETNFNENHVYRPTKKKTAAPQMKTREIRDIPSKPKNAPRKKRDEAVHESHRVSVQSVEEKLPKSPKLRELSSLHKEMLDMQRKNLELTNTVARVGASTAEAVRELLGGKTHISRRHFFPRGGGVAFDPGKPSQPKTVLIKVVFLRIFEIDTLAQQFQAEVYIEARWQETKHKGKSMSALSKVEFEDCWDPRLRILNVVDELDSVKESMVLRYQSGVVSPVLVYMWQVKGLFSERMELQTFPFDVQELSLAISSHLPDNQIDLLEDMNHDSCVNLGAMIPNEEWRNYRHVQFTRDAITREMDTQRKHPVLVVAAHAKRKLGAYFWNIVIIVFLILALTFTLLALEPYGVDRLAISMTLFLTGVAFKMVVKASLPSISYLTYLDIYVVFAMVYLFLHGVESAMMLHLSKYREPLHVKQYDEIAQAILIAFLVLFHLGFIIYIQLTVFKRRRQMARLDHDYKIKQLKKKRARKENPNQKAPIASQKGNSRKRKK